VNVAQHVERAAAWFPDHPAILFEGRALSYRELDARAGRLANDLMAHGVARGDRIALYLPNIPDFAVCYLAALKAGAVAVSINAIFKSAEVAHVVNDSGACSSPSATGRFDRPVFEGYGLTECSLFACYNHDFRHKFGSVGTAVENVELKILDEDGHDPVRGEAVRAAIVVREGAVVTPDEIVAYCRERMAVYKAPAVVDLVGELPKSATGKILKRVLRTR
jgi:acyl-CoA synthetase (AMP-forming)/AMP-acid ligase II